LSTDKFLTKSKQRWVDQFKPTAVIRGSDLRYNISVQGRYLKDFKSIIEWVIEETEKTVSRIFKSKASKEYFAEDASIASTARIDMNALTRKVDSRLNKKAKEISERMANGSNSSSKSSLHSSLEQLSGGLSIKTDIGSADIQEAFKSSVNASVDLIKTISDDYIAKVKGAVNRSIQSSGGGLSTLIPEIESFLSDAARKTKNKAKNVALDQTRKAYNGLNAARMEAVGLSKYEWVHSGGGQDPRDLHISPFPKGLNGGIFDINDPPVIDEKTGEKGIPGDAINCTCFMRPVIELENGVEVE